MTEVFAADDPYLDEDTVFGVREDLVMSYAPQPAGSFPRRVRAVGQGAGRLRRASISTSRCVRD